MYFDEIELLTKVITNNTILLTLYPVETLLSE